MDTPLILTRLESFEGRIPYMYRCTGGEVTVGIGHAILTAADALTLTWNIDGRAPTADEIAADYARIAAEPDGQVATHYKPLSQCRMSNDDIDALAAADVGRFSGLIANALPNWNTYPDCVQAALFDMAFNLGVAGLQKFKKLIAACDAADWEMAANQSHRMGIAESRNQATAALFRQALT
jgi:GH24 family phage-related lysozyme (muramidase)